MVGLGAMLREQGRHEEGTKFLQEASGIVAAPAAETSMSMRAANNGAARPFARASSLTSYAFHRASSAEKITSIKDAGNRNSSWAELSTSTAPNTAQTQRIL